jgi:hypothetical protein
MPAGAHCISTFKRESNRIEEFSAQDAEFRLPCNPPCVELRLNESESSLQRQNPNTGISQHLPKVPIVLGKQSEFSEKRRGL